MEVEKQIFLEYEEKFIKMLDTFRLGLNDLASFENVFTLLYHNVLTEVSRVTQDLQYIDKFQPTKYKHFKRFANFIDAI